ncbi:MAG: GIY-YIG nuclease family protein [Bacteroidetes bacterium]|nr:MAG: GIY-YIG nuclease family protein [Bacteroidota bacterium]
MFTVYVLYTRLYGKSYVGYTSDLAGRLISHNELGQKGWTKKYRPWEVVFTEEYPTKKEAMAREKWLKSGIGREYVKHQIEKWLGS